MISTIFDQILLRELASHRNNADNRKRRFSNNLTNNKKLTHLIRIVVKERGYFPDGVLTQYGLHVNTTNNKTRDIQFGL